MPIQFMPNQNNKNNMNILPDLLTDVFETYFGANYFIEDWERLRDFLNNPTFPDRATNFREQFASSILNETITPSILEKLTDIECETQKEVNNFLINDIWKQLYGDEPIKA